jgi:hypothetical protein
MLHKNKDIGDGARVPTLASLVMRAGIPVHRAERIGCVESSVSRNECRRATSSACGAA